MTELLPTAILRSDSIRLPPPDGAQPRDVVRLYRLFSPGQIAGATFLGGPLGGCWLLATNFKRLGDKRQAWTSILVGIVVTALMLAMGYATDGHSVMKGLAWVPVYILFATAKSVQGAAFQRHLERGGLRSSTWATVGMGLASGAIIVIVAVGGAFAVVSLTQPDSVAFDDSSVLYEDGGTEAEARAVGNELTRTGYLSPDQAVTFVVRRDHGRHIVELLVQEFVFTDSAIQGEIHELADGLATAAFHGEPVDLWLVDEHLERHVELRWGDRPHQIDLGHQRVVVYRDGAEEAEARVVGRALTDIEYYRDEPSRVIVMRQAGRHVVAFRRNGGWEEPTVLARFSTSMVAALSRRAFDGEPVDVWLMDPDEHLKVKLPWEHSARAVDAGDDNVLYHYPPVEEQQASAVARVLRRTGYFVADRPAEVILKHDGAHFSVGLVLLDTAFGPDATHPWLRGLAARLSHDALGAAPVDIQLLDKSLAVREPIPWDKRR